MQNKLSQAQKLRIVNRHKASIERNGYQAAALYWSSREVQQLRFNRLARIILDKNAALKPAKKVEKHQAWLFSETFKTASPLKVLDVGCGFGDLKAYLQQQNLVVDYLGIDVSPDMVFAAQCQYPGIAIKQGELCDFHFQDNQFDYVLLSGSLNEVVDEGGDYALAQISEMVRIAKFGVAFNLLNAEHEWIAKRTDLQSFIPADILAFCQTLVPQVGLCQDYLPEDFTLYLLKATP